MATAVKVFSNFAVDRAFTMGTAKEIRIIDHLVNGMGITFEQAEPIYDMIINAFNAGQHVVLDFEGVEIATAGFLYQMIGRLYEDHTIDEVKGMLEFSHLSQGMALSIEQTVYSARLYFADKERYTKIVEGVLNETC